MGTSSIIVADQRIVSTSEMFADDTRISVTVATVEFHESGGTTQLVLRLAAALAEDEP
jgi:hypothetical protein